MDMLKLVSREGILVIRRKFQLLPDPLRLDPVKITISMPGNSLDALILTASGNAVIRGQLEGKSTELKTSARGSIAAQGDIEFLHITSTASGNIDFTGRSRELKLSARGDFQGRTFRS